jgi:hypothetical protein
MERLGERIEEDLEHVGIQMGQFQKEALTSGGRHQAIDIKPFEDVLDAPDRFAPQAVKRRRTVSQPKRLSS